MAGLCASLNLQYICDLRHPHFMISAEAPALVTLLRRRSSWLQVRSIWCLPVCFARGRSRAAACCSRYVNTPSHSLMVMVSTKSSSSAKTRPADGQVRPALHQPSFIGRPFRFGIPGGCCSAAACQQQPEKPRQPRQPLQPGLRKNRKRPLHTKKAAASLLLSAATAQMLLLWNAFMQGAGCMSSSDSWSGDLDP